MTLSAVDWIIVVSYVVGCATIGLLVKRYVHRVADFAVAGRSVGINMGVAAMTCTGTGMVAMMYTAEMGFRYGFAGAIPGIIGGLASLLVGGSGFMVGPLRKARVITIPELLERRFRQRRAMAGRTGGCPGRPAEHGHLSAARRRVSGPRHRSGSRLPAS